MRGLKSLIKGKGGMIRSRKLRFRKRIRRDLIQTTQTSTQRKSTERRGTMRTRPKKRKGKKRARATWRKERVIWTVMSLFLTMTRRLKNGRNL